MLFDLQEKSGQESGDDDWNSNDSSSIFTPSHKSEDEKGSAVNTDELNDEELVKIKFSQDVENRTLPKIFEVDYVGGDLNFPLSFDL